MSTELEPVLSGHGAIRLTRYYGGARLDLSLQISQEEDYVSLSFAEIELLIEALQEVVRETRPEAE
jgi:hypothetical protein